jgi:hypothetical protein
VKLFVKMDPVGSTGVGTVWMALAELASTVYLAAEKASGKKTSVAGAAM